VYLYSFGDPDARIVLHHVAYGDVSGYLAVPGGEYSVAMRAAGAPATSPPVLSSSTRVSSGSAYTALAVGPRSGLRLRIFHDDLTTPTGMALVRVVQASMKHPQVTVSWGGKTIASKLAFASVTSYQAVAPGVETVAVTAGTGDTKSAVTLTAGSIHTLVVLDGAKGLEVANLEDADGSSQLPAGGAQTGFGGSAPHGPGSPLPWLEVIAAGSVLAVGGGLGLRRSRRGAAARPTLPSGPDCAGTLVGSDRLRRADRGDRRDVRPAADPSRHSWPASRARRPRGRAASVSRADRADRGGGADRAAAPGRRLR
jgi:hypothetical protein